MLEIIIAFYASGVGIAWWQIWLPSYRIIKDIQPNNIMVKKPIMSGLIVLVVFAIAFPFIAYIILFDDKIERFQNGFIKGVLGINDK
jgi:hypothetical protein